MKISILHHRSRSQRFILNAFVITYAEYFFICTVLSFLKRGIIGGASRVRYGHHGYPKSGHRPSSYIHISYTNVPKSVLTKFGVPGLSKKGVKS